MTVRNSGGPVGDVAGTVTSRRKLVGVTDGVVGFGGVGAKSMKASVDTFTVRAPAFFGRRLDRKVTHNGVTAYKQEGEDEDDLGLRGMSRLQGAWPAARTDAWYILKFSLIFGWELQARPAGNAAVIAATSLHGVTATTAPVITAASRDDAGVAVARVKLSVDGVDVTPASQVTGRILLPVLPGRRGWGTCKQRGFLHT